MKGVLVAESAIFESQFLVVLSKGSLFVLNTLMSFVIRSWAKVLCFTKKKKTIKKSMELPMLSRDKKSWREELERGKEKGSQDGVWPESMSGDTTDEETSGYRGWKKFPNLKWHFCRINLSITHCRLSVESITYICPKTIAFMNTVLKVRIWDSTW